MKNEIVWVNFNTNHYYRLLIKLNELGINILDNQCKDDSILIKTTYQDYEKIKKSLVNYSVEMVDVTGYSKKVQLFRKYIFFIVSLLVGIIFLIFVNNMTFKIVINTPNNDIKNLLIKELKQNGLTTLTLKKRHSKIEEIVKKILDNNKDTLEWLELNYDGLILIVNVTEKSSEEEKINYKYCNIIASTDAKIISLKIDRGVPLKDNNDYILKGETIISGDIVHNEEVKNKVCASGNVYGEVWYKVKINMPFLEEYKEYTGKSRYNLEIKYNDNKYQIFKSRIQDASLNYTNLYKLNNFEINLLKEKEYVLKEKILTEEEAYNKALDKITEKVKLKLDEDEEILLQKVLKKSVFDSTIYLEVFIVTKENIGELQVVKENSINNVQSNS